MPGSTFINLTADEYLTWCSTNGAWFAMALRSVCLRHFSTKSTLDLDWDRKRPSFYHTVWIWWRLIARSDGHNEQDVARLACEAGWSGPGQNSIQFQNETAYIEDQSDS